MLYDARPSAEITELAYLRESRDKRGLPPQICAEKDESSQLASLKRLFLKGQATFVRKSHVRNHRGANTGLEVCSTVCLRGTEQVQVITAKNEGMARVCFRGLFVKLTMSTRTNLSINALCYQSGQRTQRRSGIFADGLAVVEAHLVRGVSAKRHGEGHLDDLCA